MAMTFEEYLITKKIDKALFERMEKQRFDEFENIFNQVHPNSFTQQKFFLINGLRRKYPYKEISLEKAEKKVVKKPVIRSRPKPG